MRGNLFSTVFDVRREVFGEEGGEAAFREEAMSCVESGDPGRLWFLLFKMTDRCNSRCEYCPQSCDNGEYGPRTDVPLEIVLRTISEAGSLGAAAVALNGGEPLMRDDVTTIVRHSLKCGMLPVLMTNGLLLPQKWRSLGEAGLRYVIISFDSLDPVTYELQRGVSFDRAMAGIDAACLMMEEFPGTRVHVSAVLTRDNLGEFVGLVEYMSERGIAVQISPYHHYFARDDEISVEDREGLSELSRTLLQMKRAGYLISSSTGFIEHLEDFFAGRRCPAGYRCLVGYTNLFVDPKMFVRPCWDHSFKPVGNLREGSLSSFWKSGAMAGFRQRMLDCDCDGCWYMCTGEVSMMLEGKL